MMNADRAAKVRGVSSPSIMEPADTVASEADGLNEILLHGHRVFYRSAGSGPVIVMVHGITVDVGHLGQRAPVPRRALHRDRARSARSRRVGQAARRLLARGLRERHPGPAGRARAPAGDVRRALPRRRRGHAAGLPVPRALRATRPREQRRARPRDHARCCGRPAFRGPSSCSRCSSTISSWAWAGPWGVCSAASGCACTPTSGRFCAAMPRSRTARRARRSCTRSGGSSIPGPARGCERSAVPRPGDCRSWSCGASATRSSRSSTRAPPTPGAGQPARDLPGAGHFPHLDDPLRFVRLLTDFMTTTEPAHVPPPAGATCCAAAPTAPT